MIFLKRKVQRCNIGNQEFTICKKLERAQQKICLFIRMQTVQLRNEVPIRDTLNESELSEDNWRMLESTVITRRLKST